MDNHIVKIEGSSILDAISKTPILSEEDYNNLEKTKDFILSCYTDVPMYRSLPTKLYGVLNDDDHPTLQSKYWQCKVEAEVHSEECIRDFHDLELMKIKYEEINFRLEQLTEAYSIETENNKKKEIEFKARELAVSQSKIKINILKTEKRIKYRIKEVSDWKQISDKLKDEVEKNNGSILDYDKTILEDMKTKSKKIQADIPKKEIVTDSGDPNTKVV